MDLQGFVQSYGYAAVFCGTLVEGETVVIIAGFLSHRDYLHPPQVASAAFLGSFIVDQFFFFLGRRQGRQFLRRRPRWQPGALQAEALLGRFGTWLILGFRFLYGFRTVTPFVIGMSRVSALRFVILNAAGAAAWAIAFTAAGYFFGGVMETLLGDLRRYEAWLLLALASVGVAAWRFRARRAARQEDSSANRG